jgi:predicted acyl esterase
MRLVSPIAALLCTAAIAQVCPRPLPSGTGFPLQSEPAATITYSDSYVTQGELLYPAVPAPACRWPLVVFVPRLGSTRLDDRSLQQTIAAQGYAVWCYDVRGQGFAMLLNGPTAGTTMWGPVERADLVQQIAYVQAHYGTLIDSTRIAVAGSSQGGVHAWASAAFSGQSFTVPGRGSLTMPPIACAVANDYVAEPVADWIRGGLLFSSWFATLIADDTARPFVLDETFRLQARTAFATSDPQGLLAAWDLEGRRIDTRLATTQVPVLYSHAYYDLIDSPLSTLDVLRSMPATTPYRVLMSTIGHNTPSNVHELEFRDSIILRWLHRFLWSEQNGVEQEQRYVLSILPLEAARRNDPDWPWGRSFGGDPLAATGASRLYLHSDGVLRDVQPTGPGTPTEIDQVVADPLFTAEAYIQSATIRDLQHVLTACPLSEQVFASAPLVGEQQLDGSAALSLRLVPDRARWMIAALLTVQPPGGTELMLGSRGVGSTQSQMGVPERVEFRLPPVASVLPAGTVIRLRLRNLWLREAPMARQLETAPLFQDFHLLVNHAPGTLGSWLDVPLRAPTVQLVSRTLYMDYTRMDPLQLILRAGTARAGGLYYITAGVSGQYPGLTRHRTWMALHADWMTGLVENCVLLPEFNGFIGDLDALGEASALLNVHPYAPLDPVFLGTKLTFGTFAFAPLNLLDGAASNPLDILLR